MKLAHFDGDIAVLAYSGGLDTSVAINWIKEKYSVEVATVIVDVGQEEDLQEAADRALENGAVRSFVVDARDEFADSFIAEAIKANAMYEGRYPLSTALARPLIAKKIASIATRLGAKYVAHGCTGKGNDQVRIELALKALNPSLSVIAPIREWNMNRDDEVAYAAARGIKLRKSQPSRYSTDENLWGRSIEGGDLEDASVEPPEEIYQWTSHMEKWPDKPSYATIQFEHGLPVALDGRKLPLSGLAIELNRIAGANGVGRIDHVEDRFVGIKSRENYECPAAVVILQAHRALEGLVLSRELLQFKSFVEGKFSELVYNGFWFSDLMESVRTFVSSTQENVTGEVRVRMFKGTATVSGVKSDHSAYRTSLSTYSRGDSFDQRAAEGFIYIVGLPVSGVASSEFDASDVQERTVERKIQKAA